MLIFKTENLMWIDAIKLTFRNRIQRIHVVFHESQQPEINMSAASSLLSASARRQALVHPSAPHIQFGCSRTKRATKNTTGWIRAKAQPPQATSGTPGFRRLILHSYGVRLQLSSCPQFYSSDMGACNLQNPSFFLWGVQP